MTVKVRPLEWEQGWCGPDEYRHIGRDHEGERLYEIDRDGSPQKPWTGRRNGDIQPRCWAETLDGIKAASQADYDRRIIGALLYPEAPASSKEEGE